MEHAMAAITNINSIKIIDRTPTQNMLLEQAKKQLADGWRILKLTEGGEQ